MSGPEPAPIVVEPRDMDSIEPPLLKYQQSGVYQTTMFTPALKPASIRARCPSLPRCLVLVPATQGAPTLP